MDIENNKYNVIIPNLEKRAELDKWKITDIGSSNNLADRKHVTRPIRKRDLEKLTFLQINAEQERKCFSANPAMNGCWRKPATCEHGKWCLDNSEDELYSMCQDYDCSSSEEFAEEVEPECKFNLPMEYIFVEENKRFFNALKSLNPMVPAWKLHKKMLDRDIQSIEDLSASLLESMQAVDNVTDLVWFPR